MRLLCRNRIIDFDAWWEVFSAHAEAHRHAGLHLDNVWRSVEEPNDVWFVFKVTDADKARAFMDAPEAAQAAQDTRVLDGEYHFVEDAPSY